MLNTLILNSIICRFANIIQSKSSLGRFIFLFVTLLIIICVLSASPLNVG